jgi:putative ABC transport system permease protein
VSLLDRKLLRDLRALKSQALAVALVMACGLTMMVMTLIMVMMTMTMTMIMMLFHQFSLHQTRAMCCASCRLRLRWR